MVSCVAADCRRQHSPSCDQLCGFTLALTATVNINKIKKRTETCPLCAVTHVVGVCFDGAFLDEDDFVVANLENAKLGWFFHIRQNIIKILNTKSKFKKIILKVKNKKSVNNRFI
jgi:hypothetical protein